MSAAMKMHLIKLQCDVDTSDTRPRLYASGAAKKRAKKRRLDNAVAGTSKIRSFFVTTTAGEDETSKGNPENSNRDAVDVAPSVPAPEDEAAAEPAPEDETAAEPAPENEAAAEPTTTEPTTAEPATAEPARREPVVRELDLTLDNPTDRALFQLGTLPTELRTTIIHHVPCRPKRPFAISSENGNIRIFSKKNTTKVHAHSGAMETERQWLCFSPTPMQK